MFGLHSSEGYQQVLPGIQLKTLNYGKNMLMCEFRLEKGALLPEHAHEYEQTGYLVSGKIKLFIGESSHLLNPGDSWNIPSDVPHKAEILENSVALEIFNPAREDYKKYLFKRDIAV